MGGGGGWVGGGVGGRWWAIFGPLPPPQDSLSLSLHPAVAGWGGGCPHPYRCILREHDVGWGTKREQETGRQRAVKRI